MESSINLQTLLPVGEKLKPLLNKSCISESDMKDILSSRGVFIGQNNKKASIPLLTLSILSPKEFEKLQELQNSKEDSMKIRTSKVVSITEQNLNKMIPSNLISSDLLFESMDNYSFNSDLDFSMSSANKMVLDYEIVREDITKDWASCETRFSGRVEVSKDTSSKAITFKNEFTSSETENVNQKIIKIVATHLKSNGEISNTDSPFEITSDKLTNEERFAFMLRLANNSPNGFLTFEAVKNIEIGPDRTFTMPDDAKWMEGSVRNIIINSEKGETLGNVEYISNPIYHGVLILRQIQAQYKFQIGTAIGTCILEYGFPHYFRKHVKNKTFETSISKIYFSKDSKAVNIRSTSRSILNEFENLFQAEYKQIKT